MIETQLNIENKKILVFLPECRLPGTGAWYTFPNDENEARELAALLPENTALVAIIEPDWEHSFTPWAAPRLFKKGADFGGGAKTYHANLINRIIPAVERECSFQAAWRGLLGYSLAGLFALYSAIISPYFQYVASVSGSLWFDDFADFVVQQLPPNVPIYLSLGDAEAQGKNPRTTMVQIATEKIVSHWQAAGVNVFFELNSGGHFDDVAQRMATAVWHFSDVSHTVS